MSAASGFSGGASIIPISLAADSHQPRITSSITIKQIRYERINATRDAMDKYKNRKNKRAGHTTAKRRLINLHTHTHIRTDTCTVPGPLCVFVYYSNLELTGEIH